MTSYRQQQSLFYNLNFKAIALDGAQRGIMLRTPSITAQSYSVVNSGRASPSVISQVRYCWLILQKLNLPGDAAYGKRLSDFLNIYYKWFRDEGNWGGGVPVVRMIGHFVWGDGCLLDLSRRHLVSYKFSFSAFSIRWAVLVPLTSLVQKRKTKHKLQSHKKLRQTPKSPTPQRNKQKNNPPIAFAVFIFKTQFLNIL